MKLYRLINNINNMYRIIPPNQYPLNEILEGIMITKYNGILGNNLNPVDLIKKTNASLSLVFNSSIIEHCLMNIDFNAIGNTNLRISIIDKFLLELPNYQTDCDVSVDKMIIKNQEVIISGKYIVMDGWPMGLLANGDYFDFTFFSTTNKINDKFKKSFLYHIEKIGHLENKVIY